MSGQAEPHPESVSRSDVARGAGLAGLSRLSVGIEAIAQPLYIWLFGLASYGIYVVLWGAVNLLSNLLDLCLTSGLQRVVPLQRDEERANAAVKLALIVSMSTTTAAAALIALNAEWIAGFFATAPQDREALPRMIAIFVWTLPLWTFVEIATSAARARRAFGPEIRLRLFWEQVARILFALGVFALGMRSTGLIVAHLASLSITALLSVRLLTRYYDPRLLVRARIERDLARNLLISGVGLLPSELARRALVDAPAILLNLMIPGARGADAAGLFEIGRKLATVPQIVRQAFQYVLGPLSSHQASVDRSVIGLLYRFSSRVSTALVVPLAGLMIFSARDLLSVYREEAMGALPILVILSAARAADAIVGPSTAIVEMVGHRALPMLNTLIAMLVWVVLALMLVPQHGALGMAIAVAAAVLATSWAAMVELRISDGVSPFDLKLLQGLAVAMVGLAAMAGAEWLLGGPARFAAVVALWLVTTWFTLRYGLSREDRRGLGGLSKALRLPV
ncbi:lipopolysaccharide biosynthesis protein [Sphingomonas canadensis]|uniref:Lipopolysaccharide biosynthesis protein n=1 Tax=Sphingomonas canadensis TaxID=1219257 RepID=A0ABW3HC20_9SPHN|nr:lipopolysaccharide biosynthesis protein [Sphingomonas canadensis]MCW3838419.1 lipopolysaccharide biosynthesis protein [Sphingomonas canadensis]